MTATERAKRSDALYYETVSVNRRVLCDMIANREADLEDARAENAKLRDGANAIRQLYEDELRHALADNAKLREQLAKARDPQRIGGTADPESFVYAIEQLREFRWQHATNDEEAIPYINNVADAHERENAKLRELVADMWRFTGTACKKYPRLFDPAAPGGQAVQLNMIDSFEQRMRELGIEVDG